MGLFSDNIPPIRSLVSLSGRGGNATAAGASSSSSSAAAGGSNNNNNSTKPSPAGSSPASSVPVTRCDKPSLGGMSDNQKSLSASTSRCAGGGSSSMQQLSTSWEFIKLEPRPIHDLKTDDEKDEPQDVAPPRFIKISDDGKICLGPPKPCDTRRDKEVLEARIVELEEALKRLQEKVNNSQSGSPTLEKDLKEQLESMNRAMKSKERKAMQACRDHKVLQARFTRQETLLQIMQQENKTLQQRIRQYEHCLDDVMRKVVDAIVAEDSLREEVAMLKSRVRDLEAQNAALNASPAKGKDEGYCTMSSGQPQPSNGHLEDLPEEPEQWFMSAEPCSAEMEDWSMSQEELGVIALDEDSNEHDWVWNSSGYLNSTMIDSQSEGISQLLQETIVYSEDEEIACIDFTKDFYKLVSIPSGSTRSLYSHMEAETDDEDDTPSECDRLRANGGISPTPSEAGQAQVTSCSSSESDGQSRILNQVVDSKQDHTVNKTILREEIEASTAPLDNNSSWRRSSGWKRIASQSKKEIKPETHKQTPSRPRESKIPPPVPIRRSYAS